MMACVSECAKKEKCVFLFFFFQARTRVCPSIAHVYVRTSSVDLYQKPKTLQSVLVSLVLRYLDESNKIDKSLKKKKKKKKERERKKKNYHSSSGILFL